MAIKFAPLRSVRILSSSGIRCVPASEVSELSIGAKAFGLSCLPCEWTAPFFVVATPSDAESLGPEHLAKYRIQIDEVAKEVLNVPLGRKVIVRSNSSHETMNHRGSFPSEVCSVDEVLKTLLSLDKQCRNNGSDVDYWVVQEFKQQRIRGDLSNERRLKYESRDWCIEWVDSVLTQTKSIGVRHWRKRSAERRFSELACTSVEMILAALRRVAEWGTELDHRLHLEWVWDGVQVTMVQADRDRPTSGINPRDVYRHSLGLKAPVSGLKRFREVRPFEFQNYPKLKNANLYRNLGYTLPSFYLLNTNEIAGAIESGSLHPDIIEDLESLTKNAFILRTDGSNIPENLREMRPRSDELHSPGNAIDWIMSKFIPKIMQSELGRFEVVLIGHHFVPSAASAWASASPLHRSVRIESLWGIPEGLYYYAHDTFRVDAGRIRKDSQGSFSIHDYTRKLRFKANCIFPDEGGNWVPRVPGAPHDWAPSLPHEKWVAEIAHTTSEIARREQRDVAVMWFVDIPPQCSSHEVLPWYHSGYELSCSPQPVRRKKSSKSREFRIETFGDVKELNDSIAVGGEYDRIIIHPTESGLVRDMQFVSGLAATAKQLGCVIELSGGILSHAFYSLQRSGAQIECVDLFGVEDEVIEFNKLVRDGIDEIITANGELPQTVCLTGVALNVALRRKLAEEALEALDAKPGDLMEELADVLSVIEALAASAGISKKELERVRREKDSLRGGFKRGLMLLDTRMPSSGSLSVRDAPDPADINEQLFSIPSTISHPRDLPPVVHMRRPDERVIKDHHEKLLSIEWDFARNAALTERWELDLATEKGERSPWTLVLQLSRDRCLLRHVIRLSRSATQQLELDFP